MVEPDRSNTITFALSNELEARLDAHVAKFRGEFPGVRFTRSDAIRQILIEALTRDESVQG